MGGDDVVSEYSNRFPTCCPRLDQTLAEQLPLIGLSLT